MSTLRPDQWQVLSPYLDKALAMTENERAAWLSTLRDENAHLAAQLVSLLEEHRILAQKGFLDRSPGTPSPRAGLAGQVIGPYDLQIAAIALQHGLIVVTHNVAEFSRVPGLAVEDWLGP